MVKEHNTDRRGIGFAGLLTIAFIILKLCGVISWGWGWVLSPLWISLGVGLLLCVVLFVIQKGRTG